MQASECFTSCTNLPGLESDVCVPADKHSCGATGVAEYCPTDGTCVAGDCADCVGRPNVVHSSNPDRVCLLPSPTLTGSYFLPFTAFDSASYFGGCWLSGLSLFVRFSAPASAGTRLTVSLPGWTTVSRYPYDFDFIRVEQHADISQFDKIRRGQWPGQRHALTACYGRPPQASGTF